VEKEKRELTTAYHTVYSLGVGTLCITCR